MRQLQMRADAFGVVCMCVQGPCVPEEPTGPGNSQGFVGEEEGLNAFSCYTRGRCFYQHSTETKTEGVFVCEGATERLTKQRKRQQMRTKAKKREKITVTVES